MKRSWLKFLAGALFAAFVAQAGTARAHHGGGSPGSSGGQSSVRQATFHAPITGIQPVKINPTLPVNPIGPGKIGVSPIGPGKLPGNGTIIVTDPGHPTNPLGPVTFPGGGKIGPSGPIGPIGPVGPPKPPSGGSGNCNVGCKPWWPPIILGCVPYGGFGGYGGYYGGNYPVYSQIPVYSQSVVMPATTPVAISDSTPATPTTVASLEKLPQVPVGSTLTLNAKELGSVQGQTLLLIDKLTLGVQVDEWTGDHATVTLPMLSISGPTKAEIVLVKPDGHAASNVQVELVSPPERPASNASGSVAAALR